MNCGALTARLTIVTLVSEQNVAVTAVDAPWNEAADPLKRLTAATTYLATAADVETVLLASWDGLGAARACGLLAAQTAPVWAARGGNAARVEFDWAARLVSTLVVGIRRTVLPASAADVDTAALTPGWAVSTVAAIDHFAEVAASAMWTAGGEAEDWPSIRGLRCSVVLARSLAGCWRGENPFYALDVPDPVPRWWQ